MAVCADHVLGKCAVLEFVRTFGSKGGDDDECSLETEAEGVYAAYREDLSQIGAYVKDARLNAVESIDMTIRLVTEWCERKFGPVCEMELPEVIRIVKRLGKLIYVGGERRGRGSVGKPGRKETTHDIALFARIRRSKSKPDSWKQIFTAWKTANPTDERVKKVDHIREAHRRHFGDKVSLKK